MSDIISDPLLALIKEQNLIDDLQYEEVQGEFTRNGKPIIQILQDLGIMDIGTILQIEADALSTEVVSLPSRQLTPEIIAAVPASTARMYRCVPVAVYGSTVQIAPANPLDPRHIDELGFVLKKDIVVV